MTKFFNDYYIIGDRTEYIGKSIILGSGIDNRDYYMACLMKKVRVKGLRAVSVSYYNILDDIQERSISSKELREVPLVCLYDYHPTMKMMDSFKSRDLVLRTIYHRYNFGLSTMLSCSCSYEFLKDNSPEFLEDFFDKSDFFGDMEYTKKESEERFGGW
jgi:hypothetical protein